MSAPRPLSDVRRDLTDGEDLALAVRLIGDTIARRMRRARDLLAASELQEVTEETDAAQLRELRRRADEVEDELKRLSERFAALVGGFEDELQGFADELDDTER